MIALATIAFPTTRSALQPTVMPYAPAALTDSQIAAIAAYLRAIPRGKPAKDIPLLN